MAELDPLFVDGLGSNLSGQSERQTFAPLQAGVMDPGDLKVTPGAGARELIVAAGVGFPRGNNVGVLDQGLYRVRNDAAKSSTLFEAGGPTAAVVNPRLDQIVARVWDHAADGLGFRKWRLAVVQGAETAGATLDSRAGVAALPPNCLLLADVITRPGMTVYPAIDVRDRRLWARGAFRMLTDTPPARSTASGAFVQVSSALQVRVECSGAPVRLTMRGAFRTSPGNTGGTVCFRQDGTPVSPTATLNPSNVYVQFMSLIAILQPVPGSHLFDLAYRADSGGNTITLDVDAFNNPTTAILVEELLRQNADNT